MYPPHTPWAGPQTQFEHLCFSHLIDPLPRIPPPLSSAPHHSINQTDQMLVHLQSFNTLPENYTIPESTKNGVPLFYIPPGSTTPVRTVRLHPCIRPR